jgi:hypothetical protein
MPYDGLCWISGECAVMCGVRLLLLKFVCLSVAVDCSVDEVVSACVCFGWDRDRFVVCYSINIALQGGRAL